MLPREVVSHQAFFSTPIFESFQDDPTVVVWSEVAREKERRDSFLSYLRYCSHRDARRELSVIKIARSSRQSTRSSQEHTQQLVLKENSN
jgi:hypothetical protein